MKIITITTNDTSTCKYMNNIIYKRAFNNQQKKLVLTFWYSVNLKKGMNCKLCLALANMRRSLSKLLSVEL